MSAYLMPNGRQHYTDLAGLPLIGGKVNTYIAGTNTRKDTYADVAGTVPNTNPVVLDVRGEAAIHWGDGAYKIVLTDAIGNVIWSEDNLTSAESFGAGAIGAVTNRLADTALAANGAGMVGLNLALNYVANTVGWGIRVASNLTNALRYVPPAEWAAIANASSNTDLTAYIQAAINAERGLFFPPGKWPVSATTGLFVKDGTLIRGAGKANTIFWAILGTGGSAAELAAYSKGSVFRRTFVSGGANPYVGECVFEDFAIVLNHPTGAITASAIQLGMDMRNMTRCHLTRIHVGNDVPISSIVPKAAVPAGYNQQGYGMAFGNVSSSSPDYCGGEVHTVRECSVWGAYKLITCDDPLLSPVSAAHAVCVYSCDLQGGHHGLVQESKYTTGVRWDGNIVQNAQRKIGDASPTYILRFTGYGSTMKGGYMECGPNADFILKLENTSANNDFSMDYYSATSLGAAISDLGTRNRLRYFANSGAVPGGIDSAGAEIVTYNRAPFSCTYKGFWNGAGFTVLASNGMTLIRNGVGDYTINLAKNQPNADWDASILIDTNASGHGGFVTTVFNSQSVGALRFYTYAQNAAVSTQLDPRMMYITVTQAVT